MRHRTRTHAVVLAGPRVGTRGSLGALLMLAALLVPAHVAVAQLRITGQVVDAASSRPIAGVRVVVSPSGASAQATTDSLGRFTLELPTGPVVLVASRAGWRPSVDTVLIASGSTERTIRMTASPAAVMVGVAAAPPPAAGRGARPPPQPPRAAAPANAPTPRPPEAVAMMSHAKPPVATAVAGIPANSGAPSAADSQFTYMDVFYGTNRGRGDGTGGNFYSSSRGTLEFGISRVSVPTLHRPGEIEKPGRKWIFWTEAPDPARHMLVRSTDPLDEEAWVAALRGEVEATAGKEVIAYVHGYNNSFGDATLRAAQLGFDLGAEGAYVAMFSWPSQATLAGYPADEAASEVAIPALQRFLVDLADRTGAKRVHLIGHSMGTRVLSAALRNLHQERSDTVFTDVVLAAADIDAQVFTEQIAPALLGVAHRVTMYTSTGDNALRMSQKFHQGARAGERADALAGIAGLDVIDATNAEADWLDHGYIATNKALLDDLFMLLMHGLPPDRRNLRLPTPEPVVGRYWIVP